MELSKEQELELLTAVKKHQPEATNKLVFKDCKSYDSQLEFGLAIRQMINLGLIYKKDELLFVVDLTGDAKPRPAKDLGNAEYYSTLAKVKVEEPKARHNINFGERRVDPTPVSPPAERRATPVTQPKEEKKVEKKEKPLPNGDIRRSVTKGAIALALYKCRNDPPLTKEDIAPFLKNGIDHNWPAHAKYLIGKGVIEQDKTFYRWSGKFNYPFPDVRENDDDELKITYKEWKERKTPTLREALAVTEKNKLTPATSAHNTLNNKPTPSTTNTMPVGFNPPAETQPTPQSTEEKVGEMMGGSVLDQINDNLKQIALNTDPHAFAKRFVDALSLIKWQIKTAESKLESLKLIESMIEKQIAELSK